MLSDSSCFQVLPFLVRGPFFSASFINIHSQPNLWTSICRVHAVHSLVFALLYPPACHSRLSPREAPLLAEAPPVTQASPFYSTTAIFPSPLACLRSVLPGSLAQLQNLSSTHHPPNLINPLITMATTAMDYENPGGDRFEGQFSKFCFCPIRDALRQPRSQIQHRGTKC